MKPLIDVLFISLLLWISSAPAGAIKNAKKRKESSPSDEKSTKASEKKKSDISPPQVIKIVPAEYPQGAKIPPDGIKLMVEVQISVQGKVLKSKVVKSGGKAFDQEALKAVAKWIFKPAAFKGRPMRASMQIPFEFPPLPDKEEEIVEEEISSGEQEDPVAKDKTRIASGNSAGAREDSKQDKSDPISHKNNQKNNASSSAEPEDQIVVTTYKSKKKESRPVSEFKITKAVFAITSKKSGGDILKAAPGFYVAKPQNEGIANAIFLRGFNARHGQDFEMWAGEVPINLDGHIHAQGYADMHFLIPETIHSLNVLEGVYDPVQGNFAVAGSGYFKYGVENRGSQVSYSQGSYNSRRLLLLHAPKGESRETFLAVSLKESDGFGTNRSYRQAKVAARYALVLGTRAFAVFHLGAYGSRSVLPGVLKLEDIESGNIGLYDTYNDPTAQSQSSSFSRFEASMRFEQRLSKPEEKLEFSAYFLRTNFRLRQNFTGYTLWFNDKPELKGMGDLHQQVNFATTVGGKFSYTSATHKIFGFDSRFKYGVQLRSDWIEQSEDLILPAQNAIWRKNLDADIQIIDAGLFLDSEFALSKYIDLKAGLRADSLTYQIDDKLGNWQYNTPTVQNYELGKKRDAMGTFYGPRMSLKYNIFPGDESKNIFKGLALITAYGQGFRSPPPRTLEEGEDTPFAKVHSLETGLKWNLWGGKKYYLKLSGFYTYLSDDYTYDPTTAMARSIGDTTRYGSMLYLVSRPLKGLIFSGSITYSRGVLEGPPLATTDNPTPGQKKGDLISYIPPLVGRIDLGYRHNLLKIRGYSLKAVWGATYSYTGSRPLPYSQWADPIQLLDLSCTVLYRNLSLKFEVSNLFDHRWHEMEYNFVSQWDPNVQTSLPKRHVVAGAPRMITATLAIKF
ncbi:MAG: TonB family protein [Deltaproteobacteria bacterium]|jgi:iron complex outermembrane receptor protein|nr:TonB family protein [Deltaproteobacteria bacterium]